ncbi:MAG: hypothetical protein V4557_08320 [Bacteroidota bacterium]
MNLSTDLTSIEVREGWKKYYLIGFLGWMAFVAAIFIIWPKQTAFFFYNTFSMGQTASLFFLIAIPAICIFYYLDTGIKVRIDQNGVWRRKDGIIEWNTVWHFHTTILKSGLSSNTHYLKLKLKDTQDQLDKEITVKFRRTDKKFVDIRDVVSYYAQQHGIEDMGHEKEI